MSNCLRTAHSLRRGQKTNLVGKSVAHKSYNRSICANSLYTSSSSNLRKFLKVCLLGVTSFGSFALLCCQLTNSRKGFFCGAWVGVRFVLGSRFQWPSPRCSGFTYFLSMNYSYLLTSSPILTSSIFPSFLFFLLSFVYPDEDYYRLPHGLP